VSAYVILDIDVRDPEGYKEYVDLSTGTMDRFGGRFLVRGGETETLEGEWLPRRVVVLEFPDADAAQAWWTCEEYEQAKAVRRAVSEAKAIVVEGIA
jgi:uncharacterized protein (DUF1330 family)